jgi:hypothetical protein
MASKVERYRELYGQRKDNLLDLVLPAGSAYDRAKESGTLSEEDLRVIIDAAAHERLLVAMNAVELLWAMSDRWPAEISRAVAELFSSPKSHARFAAICVLTTDIDKSVARDVVKGGLKDKSARVRWKAADRAEWLERRDLIPDVEAALAVEKNAKSKRSIEHSLRFLRDGYTREDQEDGKVTLWVRTRRGHSGRDVDAREIEEKGIETVVEAIRRERDY